jgi:hypothetical protein
VRLVVSAPGYDAWQFIDSQGGPPGVIRLESEEKKELSIRLHKQKG